MNYEEHLHKCVDNYRYFKCWTQLRIVTHKLWCEVIDWNKLELDAISYSVNRKDGDKLWNFLQRRLYLEQPSLYHFLEKDFIL